VRRRAAKRPGPTDTHLGTGRRAPSGRCNPRASAVVHKRARRAARRLVPDQAARGTSPSRGSGSSGLSAEAATSAASMPSVACQSWLRTRAASCGGSSLTRTTPSIMSASTAGQVRPRLRTDTSTEPPGPRRSVRSSPATRGGVRKAGTRSSITAAAAARRRPASANLQTCLSLMTTL